MTARTTRSRALHASKRNKRWARHPQDFYVEPSWCGERLFAAENFEGRVWDPACGLGRIPTAARNAGLEAFLSDIQDRGCAEMVCDFLKCTKRHAPNIVSNPPFGIARPFIEHALQLAERKVAMLLPAAWVSGQERSRWLASTPLRRVYFITPRPSMPPGPVVMAGEEPSNGLSDFAWFVWHRGYDGTPEIRWIRRDDGPTPRIELKARDREQFMGPEEKKRHTTKASGKLKPAKGLPLLKAVTRDSAEEKPNA